MLKRCPHQNVANCPLYIAAHGVPGLGCDDGMIDHAGGTCGVARAVSYERNVEMLRVKSPGLVEQCEWREQAARFNEQRNRNMRLNGIH